MLPLAIVLTAAFGAGLIDSMVGGGGLIQTPALFAIFPDTPHAQLLGTSKLAGIGGTVSAVFRYARSVRIPWLIAIPALVGAFFAALLGAVVTTRLPADIFRPLVPLMLTAVFIYVARRHDFGQHHAPQAVSRREVFIALIGGSVIGFYDGFFGPGTGTFLVFFFVKTFALDFLHASATAKVVNVAANAAALLIFGFTGNVLWLLGFAMMVCNIGGSIIGSHLAIRHGSAFVRRIFLVVVSLLIAKTGWDALRAYF
ncbi:MAG: TSUP family transporter [Candidatus Obscuribacterales bacterium]|nr:TSUP family transporter [Steroidobacteraceae bacterium]